MKNTLTLTMGVFDELRQRGVEDVLFVSMDGVSGLADGLRAIFPDAVAQRCLVHLVRNSCKYVPSKDMQAFCRDARAFYGAPSLSACRAAFADFSEAWARYPGAVATWERSMAEVERLFSYGPDVRRVMYTTNAVESVNASFRKVVRRGCFPDEDAVMKLLYLRVKELYSRWGEGCHQPGWARVRNQLLCDEGIRARIERFL